MVTGRILQGLSTPAVSSLGGVSLLAPLPLPEKNAAVQPLVMQNVVNQIAVGKWLHPGRIIESDFHAGNQDGREELLDCDSACPSRTGRTLC